MVGKGSTIPLEDVSLWSSRVSLVSFCTFCLFFGSLKRLLGGLRELWGSFCGVVRGMPPRIILPPRIRFVDPSTKGLGISNLVSKNIALVGNWLWRFPLEPRKHESAIQVPFPVPETFPRWGTPGIAWNHRENVSGANRRGNESGYVQEASRKRQRSVRVHVRSFWRKKWFIFFILLTKP